MYWQIFSDASYKHLLTFGQICVAEPLVVYVSKSRAEVVRQPQLHGKQCLVIAAAETSMSMPKPSMSCTYSSCLTCLAVSFQIRGYI